MRHARLALALALALAPDTPSPWPTRARAEPVIVRTAAAADEDPARAGARAAADLKTALGGEAPKAILVMDSFEDLGAKRALLDSIASVFPRELLSGGASYGGFTQGGSIDDDGVVLLGLGGDALEVQVAFAEGMGAVGLTIEKDQERLAGALAAAGERLARQLSHPDRAALMLLVSDAHSPKNQLLLDGIQKVTGTELPITGGSVNKNAGQNWVYHRGAPHTDSAVALLLTGPFQATQTGRQAKTNDAVIATAREGAAAALGAAPSKPFALLAFNCGGRKGKLERLEDELHAIQSSIGESIPLFGAYCAGEYGPADLSENDGGRAPRGRGWHVMFSALAR